MRKFLLLTICALLFRFASGQSFEVVALQDTYRGLIGETIKAPIRFKNTSDKPITLIIRKIDSQIGSTQKNFFCVGENCLEQKVEDYIIKVEPGQTLSSLQVALEAGLVPGISSVHYLAFSRSNPSHTVEFRVNFAVDEKPEKQDMYSSRFITIHDVYPNPVTDNNAYIDYSMLSEQVKAKIIMHNLLGNPVGLYPLSSAENRVRLRTDELSAGIYFITLYLENESVMTRKLIVKK